MNEQDETRLRDTLDAAHKARQFTAGRTRAALDDDEMLAYALVRALEIVGEAASRVSAETRESLPQIPWHQIIGMRHKLAHDYISVNYDIVWTTIVDDLPSLIDGLESALNAG